MKRKKQWKINGIFTTKDDEHLAAAIKAFETAGYLVERKDEKSYFFRLLYSSKVILMNNNNDNETLYKVRLDIMNFITAFVEERGTG